MITISSSAFSDFHYSFSSTDLAASVFSCRSCSSSKKLHHQSKSKSKSQRQRQRQNLCRSNGFSSKITASAVAMESSSPTEMRFSSPKSFSDEGKKKSAKILSVSISVFVFPCFSFCIFFCYCYLSSCVFCYSQLILFLVSITMIFLLQKMISRQK